MKCPRDLTQLTEEVFCGVEIDSCGYCDGTWLDKGEMAKIVGLEEDISGGEEVSPEDLKDRTDGELFGCPRCNNVKMKPFDYSYKKHVIIDVCPACGGIWLDGSELKEVVKAAYEESM
ncbi:MAG: zf-TFIIB domain-containing protein [Vulcanimicrobiota bacterium]